MAFHDDGLSGRPGLGPVARKALSWTRTLELLKPLADGLDHAHAHHIIHRDLKPGNIFITHEGQVKLLDFILAYRLHLAGTQMNIQESNSRGTPQYMPPEAFMAGALQRRPDLMPEKPAALTEAAWEVLKSGLAAFP